MNTIGYFEIQAAQPEKMIPFYEAVFGWKFIRLPQVPIPYYRIETNGISGGLLQRPAQVPPPEYGTNAFTCSVQVADYDQTAASILSQGGRVAMAKFAVPNTCWQGYFTDPDNNVFGIFQVDELAN